MHTLRTAKQRIGPLIIVMAAAIVFTGCHHIDYRIGHSRDTKAYNACRSDGYPIGLCTEFSTCMATGESGSLCWNQARCRTFSTGDCPYVDIANPSRIAHLPYPDPPNWCSAL